MYKVSLACTYMAKARLSWKIIEPVWSDEIGSFHY
jgi:hypothetical protein